MSFVPQVARSFGQYAFNLVHMADQVANTLIGGDPRMTLSARMGRDLAAGRCSLCGKVCRVLNLIQAQHCQKAWASELVAPDPRDQVLAE